MIERPSDPTSYRAEDGHIRFIDLTKWTLVADLSALSDRRLLYRQADNWFSLEFQRQYIASRMATVEGKRFIPTGIHYSQEQAIDLMIEHGIAIPNDIDIGHRYEPPAKAKLHAGVTLPKMEEPLPEGPTKDFQFVYNGTPHIIGAGKIWQLLVCLWPHGNSPVDFTELGERVWDDDITNPITIRSLISRLNTKFLSLHIPISWVTRNEQAIKSSHAAACSPRRFTSSVSNGKNS